MSKRSRSNPMNCPHCNSDRSTRAGRSPLGKQVYRCGECGRRWVDQLEHTHPTLTGEEMLRLYNAGATMQAIATQAGGISRERVRQMLEETPGFTPRNVGKRAKS